MHSNNSNGSGVASARRFAALWAALAIGLGLMASPAAAAPFAYVPNGIDGTVSVIDTATNTVVGTAIPVGNDPGGIAVTPDGKHVYVANLVSSNVSVIDTATNTVMATVGLAGLAGGIAVTPDGKHAYVTHLTNSNSSNVSVIDTATNTVVATVVATVGQVNGGPGGIAVTPDGKHVYVANLGSKSVSVIDTATNMVEAATLAVGNVPARVAVTPDGKHVYVTNFASNNVSVIDTATNTVEAATLAVGNGPIGVAVTPDGKHAYVANSGDNTVSVIDTATNTVEAATIMVGNNPNGVGIMPPPVGVHFLAFNAKLEIDLDRTPKEDRFELQSSFTLGSASNGINPVTEAVTLQVGTFTTTIPPGSFKIADDEGDQKDQDQEGGFGVQGVGLQVFGPFSFDGVIDGVVLHVLIQPTGTKRYALEAEARHANLTGTKNPVQVTLIIGDDSGMISVKAKISP